MPRLRDGVIKRGGSWSYVIRVPDRATGISKPKWVGGFETEEDAKAARDEARVRARRGVYVNRSTSTVANYLAEWAEAHASTVKPKTLAGYRHDINHYIVPRIGRMRLQALRPAVYPSSTVTWRSTVAVMDSRCRRGRFLTYTALCASGLPSRLRCEFRAFRPGPLARTPALEQVSGNGCYRGPWVRRTFPLAGWRPWRRPAPRTGRRPPWRSRSSSSGQTSAALMN